MPPVDWSTLSLEERVGQLHQNALNLSTRMRNLEQDVLAKYMELKDLIARLQ
jgi:hypothetical protein